jgi:hypothetical protein
MNWVLRMRMMMINNGNYHVLRMLVSGWGQGGEMTQALYAHMNNKIIKKKKECW